MKAEFHLRTILVPTDCSGESLEALRYAMALAAEFEARVVVMHVVQLNVGGEELGVPRTRLLHQMGEAARMQLRQVVELLAPADTSVQIVIAEGQPHEEILDQARQRGTELIIMAAHRYAGLLRWFHPHTVDHILRNAPCPVLLVSSHGRGFLRDIEPVDQLQEKNHS